MEFVKAKTILSKVNYGNDWYGIETIFWCCQQICNLPNEVINKK